MYKIAEKKEKKRKILQVEQLEQNDRLVMGIL